MSQVVVDSDALYDAVGSLYAWLKYSGKDPEVGSAAIRDGRTR